MFPDEHERFESLPSDLQQQYLAKESFPALYCRLMLIWCSCLRMRSNMLSELHESDQPPDEVETKRAAFALRAWLEISAIERAIDQHSCHKDSYTAAGGRNWIFGCVFCSIL
jgi:hypothetical protein